MIFIMHCICIKAPSKGQSFEGLADVLCVSLYRSLDDVRSRCLIRGYTLIRSKRSLLNVTGWGIMSRACGIAFQYSSTVKNGSLDACFKI